MAKQHQKTAFQLNTYSRHILYNLADPLLIASILKIIFHWTQVRTCNTIAHALLNAKINFRLSSKVKFDLSWPPPSPFDWENFYLTANKHEAIAQLSKYLLDQIHCNTLYLECKIFIYQKIQMAFETIRTIQQFLRVNGQSVERQNLFFLKTNTQVLGLTLPITYFKNFEVSVQIKGFKQIDYAEPENTKNPALQKFYQTGFSFFHASVLPIQTITDHIMGMVSIQGNITQHLHIHIQFESTYNWTKKLWTDILSIPYCALYFRF